MRAKKGKAKAKPKEKAKTPKVRMAKPAGRPIQLRYFCPVEKREIRISTQTYDEAEAQEQLDKLEAKLLLGFDVKPRKITAQAGPQMPWDEFRDEYTRLKVATFRSAQAQQAAEARLDICESIIKPRTLGEMATPATLARLQAELLVTSCNEGKSGRSPHTVRSYMASLVAALNWAHRPMKWLPEACEFDLLSADDPDKGRPLCLEEFERMTLAVAKGLEADDPDSVKAETVESWRYLLRGLWESGLRLGEALNLSWDIDGTIRPQWNKRGLPVLLIPAKMQKNRKAMEVPTTPAFVALLEETPKDDRTGWVFRPRQLRRHSRPTLHRTSRIITAIGKAANVIVNAAGKPASAHDLRRSFGQRLADAGLPPRDLQAIMRHASFTTTEAYYLRDRVQDQAARIAKYLGTATLAAPSDERKKEASNA